MSTSSSQPVAEVDYAADIGGDFTNRSTDKSSGLRKWSRNLSAQRHRELSRLNQIERERQFLELKRQNDLFDQMSATANKRQTSASELNVQQQQASDSQAKDTVTSDAIVLAETSKPKSAMVDDSRLGSAAAMKLENERKQAGNLDAPPKLNDPPPVENADLIQAIELLVTSQSPPEDKQAAEQRPLAHQAKRSLRLGSGTQESSTKSQVQERANMQTAHGSNSSDQKCNGKDEECLVGDLQQFFVKMPITTDQLEQFVSARVPENKRVLCLIVRDKMSRLSKAKSYFYPTYYLFIQAIVDIDDTCDLSLVNTRGSDDDILGVNANGDSEINPANASVASADNSFSASSSISADMLFIGTNSGNGAANLANVKLSGNSYSDNEVYADTETEDDYHAQQQGHASADSGSNKLATTSTSKTTVAKHLRAKSGLSITNKSAASSLQGRDSPLVFPNRAINNTATTTTVSVSYCDTSESGSLAAGWPASTETLNGLIDGRRTRLQSQHRRLDLKTAVLNDGSQEDLDEEDSDNDEPAEQLHCEKRAAIDGGDDDDDGVDYGDSAGITGRYSSNNSNLQQQDLFDNDRNPYTGTYGILLAGRRRKKAKTYLIGPNEHGYTRRNSICKLKSNVLGTQFNAIRLNHSEGNNRCTIASISYETNVLGFKGPRKMRVFLAKDLSKGSKNLPEMFKKNPTAVVQLKNMTPSWNVESQSYVLNFHGRVTQASVKNFQLIECEDHLAAEGQRQGQSQLLSSNGRLQQQHQPLTKDAHACNYDQQQQQRDKKSHLQQQPIDRLALSNLKDELDEGLLDTRATINSQLLLNNVTARTDSSSLLAGSKSLTYNSAIVMQFGRISNHEFTCDVTYPLSILQAFAIALSSFDSKLACE